MRKIKVKEITAENFKEFGSFTDFMNPDGYSLGDFYQDRLRMHSSGNMNMTFSPLLIRKPEKMIVNMAEYHNYTQEGVLCLDDDVIVHVAPAGKEPIPEFTEAFYVPQGTMVLLHTGVWHLSAIPVNKDLAHVMIALPERTYANDCVVVEYPEEKWIEMEM